jgi:hypothetical protein
MCVCVSALCCVCMLNVILLIANSTEVKLFAPGKCIKQIFEKYFNFTLITFLGVEYSLLFVQEPILYVIRCQCYKKFYGRN